MKNNIVITAIICITILESVALKLGFNGAILTTVVALIAGLAGLATKRPKILQN